MRDINLTQTSFNIVVALSISILLLACGSGGGDRAGIPTPMYILSGKVTGGSTLNVTITLSNNVSYTTKADGLYNFSLLAGTYTVTPSKLGYTFSPASATVAVSTLLTVPDFIATGKLNDTGITNMQCYRAASDVLGTCAGTTGAVELNNRQDGMVGRDVTNTDATDGKLGFSFSKICNNGEFAGLTNCSTNSNPGYSLTDWGCTQDNVTGLMWEVKTTSGLRNWSTTYTNYDSTTANQKGRATPPTQAEIDAATNSIGFKNAVNATNLCGYSDWRMPTADELQSIVDYGVASPGPTVDANWFPNTQGNAFWSSSPYVGNPASAWGVDFGNGGVGDGGRYGSYYVRLVRAGQ